MPESKAAWNEASERFNALGRRLKEGLEQQGAAQQTAAARESVQAALRAVGSALDELFTALGNVIRDPAFRDEARQAAGALKAAIAATVGQAAGRAKPSRPAGPAGTAEAPTTDAPATAAPPPPPAAPGAEATAGDGSAGQAGGEPPAGR